MVHSKELRIGNMLMWNPKLINPKVTLPAFPVTVASIFADRIGYTSPGMEHRVEPFEDDLLQLDTPNKGLEEFEPILLTDDILTKCGFEKSSSKWTSIKNKSIKLHHQKGDIDTYGLIVDGKDELANMTALHQLQNLYYALTGGELDPSL